MTTVWYALVALMLIAYVALDGFDLGAGALFLFAARSDRERAILLRAIGPVWDGNEVWLIAAGGTLFFAFPLLYASSFSGFYLPLNIVLWLLIFRALGIEFRAHSEGPLARDFFGVMFCLSSALLIVFFGAALGNVLRGVALGPDHYFFAPLWTDFRPGPDPGILDWYTILCALLAVAVVAVHGALYLAMKTEGPLQSRARAIALRLLPAVALLEAAALSATLYIRPALLSNYNSTPIAWLIPALVAASLGAIFVSLRRDNDRAAFLSSTSFIGFTLAGAAWALYPVLLPATTGDGNALTIYNASAGDRSLALGLWWWVPGMLVATAYFVLVYRTFSGKVTSGPDYTGH